MMRTKRCAVFLYFGLTKKARSLPYRMIARFYSAFKSILFLPVLILDDQVIVVVDFVPFSLLIVKGFQKTVCPIRIISPEPLRLGPLLHFFMLGMRFHDKSPKIHRNHPFRRHLLEVLLRHRPAKLDSRSSSLRRCFRV